MKAGVYIHLEEFDEVSARFNPDGDLILCFGGDVRVFIQPLHKHYPELCKQFGLYEDDTPGSEILAQETTPQEVT